MDTTHMSLEEIQYIAWNIERRLESAGYAEQCFPTGRSVTSVFDAIGHARYTAHQISFQQDQITALSMLNRVNAILWCYGMGTEEEQTKEMADWLVRMTLRVREKLVGQTGQLVPTNRASDPAGANKPWP